jgi:hypothetical protein
VGSGRQRIAEKISLAFRQRGHRCRQKKWRRYADVATIFLNFEKLQAVAGATDGGKFLDPSSDAR